MISPTADTPMPRVQPPTAPRVSILLPVRNGAATLEATLRSLTAQTYQDFEIVCIDDASTDTTPAILKRWHQRLGNRLTTLTHAKNWGLTRSLNQAITTARGELLARIDADDAWLPEKLHRQVIMLDSNPSIGIIGCWYENITPQGGIVFSLPETNAAIQQSMFRQNPLGHSCVVIRKYILVRHGGYDESIRFGQDHELWLRLLPHTSFYNIPAVLCQRQAGGVSDQHVRRQMLQGIHTRLHYLRRYRAPLREYRFLLEPLAVAIAPAPARRLWRHWRARRAPVSQKQSRQKRPRIACINDRFLPSTRAEQVARINMAAGFTAAGAAVDFWYHSRPRRPRPLPMGPDMHIHPVRAPYLAGTTAAHRYINQFLFAMNACRLAIMLPRTYDVLYLRCGALHGLLFAARSFFDPAHIVLEVHNLTFGNRPLIDRLYRRIFSRCHRVICISSATQENWRAAGIQPNKIVRLSSGAPSRNQALPSSRQAKQRLGLPDGPVAAYSGNLYPDRNIAEIIAAAAALPHIVFALVGGTSKDISSWQQHSKKAHGSLPNIRFFGYQPAALIPLYLQAADVILVTYSYSCPTVATMSPMKFAEATAAGKPIVAADLPRIREMAGQHQVEWYTSDDSRSLSQAISTACQAPLTFAIAPSLTWQQRAHAVMQKAI